MIEQFIFELTKIGVAPSAELILDLEQKVKVQLKPKGSILLNEGDCSNNVIFLLEGLARGFYYKDDTEVTSWVLAENNFVFSPSSFLAEVPLNESIQLLENSRILIIRKQDFLELQVKYSEIHFLIRKVLEKHILCLDLSVRFLRLTAEERLNQFEIVYPKTSQRLSISQLSTYLGLSKSSISHIRNRK